MLETTCAFFGHRKINISEELEKSVRKEIENLIVNEKVDTFLFGSRSDFIYLCHDIVTELKGKHPHIKRIYVRAEYPFIDDSYRNMLLENYEDTYFPENLLKAGSAVYVERNYQMIDGSKFCVFYLSEDCAPKNRKSGTKLAYDYAVKKTKSIKVFSENLNLPYCF